MDYEMTKAQLIRALEPFDDDIQIISFNDHDYEVSHLQLFYNIGRDGDANIVIGLRRPDWPKIVELKV